MPTSHHYDNDSKSVSAAPIYSTVKPRAKQQSLPPSVTPIYDIASPTGQKPGEGSDYQLVAGKERVVKEGRVSAVWDLRGHEDSKCKFTLFFLQLRNLQWTVTIMKIFPLQSQMWPASVRLAASVSTPVLTVNVTVPHFSVHVVTPHRLIISGLSLPTFCI